jgi:hypothetical protein
MAKRYQERSLLKFQKEFSLEVLTVVSPRNIYNPIFPKSVTVLIDDSVKENFSIGLLKLVYQLKQLPTQSL